MTSTVEKAMRFLRNHCLYAQFPNALSTFLRLVTHLNKVQQEETLVSK